jgi:3-oxoacyl-[acyl-carrier-protein] synthase III
MTQRPGYAEPKGMPRPMPPPAKHLGVCIAGVGSYLPTATITNEDLRQKVDTSDEWIMTRTGIRERRIAAPDQSTSDLALPAALEALAQARLSPEDLDLIILATATPDTFVPPGSAWLHGHLGAVNAAAMDLSAACSGFLFAVHTAAGLIRAGMHKNVLVVGAETLTRITDYTDRATCILFGDGAGAAVLGKQGYLELLYSSIGTDSTGRDLIRVPAGGSREPASAETIAGKKHFLQLQGREVFRRAVETMTRSGEAALEALDMKVSDLAWLVPHQANLRITQAVASQFDLPPDRVIGDMAGTGNTSAASLPIALNRLQGSGLLKPGDRVMLVGFGAGLTWGCQVYENTGVPV